MSEYHICFEKIKQHPGYLCYAAEKLVYNEIVVVKFDPTDSVMLNIIPKYWFISVERQIFASIQKCY